MVVAAIYARKSKATETGESIHNQLDRCRAYAYMKDWDVIEYLDEDYSGGDINRPGFQKMLEDMELGKFQNIIFYKLDRVSRKVLDICNFIEELNNKGIGFVSVKENFDTTTPIGRAMLLITAVFAQLERETIAERVRDNMHDLAKRGYWLGGKVPYGFINHKVNANGKKITELKPHPQESLHVKEIFQLYLKNNSSISKVQKLLEIEGIKTKEGNNFSLSQVKRILNNPIYVMADSVIYQYFKSLGCNIDSPLYEFDGNSGLIRYNFKRRNTNQENPPVEWIISVSKVHQGLVDGKTFLQTQKILSKRRNIPKRQSRRGLLTGILFCGDCGGYMGIGDGPTILATGEKSTYYRCMNRKNNRCDCHNCNIRSDVMDGHIIDVLSSLMKEKNHLQVNLENILKHSPSIAMELQAKRQRLNQELISIERNLSKLLEESIIGNFSTNIIEEKSKEYYQRHEYLRKKLEKLDEEIHIYNIENFDLEIFQKEILEGRIIQQLTFQQQQKIIQNYIEKIFWNQGNLSINFKKQ